MFKLKKILNKHNNAPEIEILPLEASSYSKPGQLFLASNGELTAQIGTEYSDTIYVVLDEINDYSESRLAKCFRVTPDMIFEVECKNVNTIFGNKFTITTAYTSYGYDGILIVSDETKTSTGYVVDTSDLAKNKTVLVRFHCKQ